PQGDQAEPRASGHRGNVAHVDRYRLVPEVPRRDPRRIEMDALDQHVHGEDQDALADADQRAVVAGSDQDLRRPVADDAAKGEHEVVLTKPSITAPTRVARHRSLFSDPRAYIRSARQVAASSWTAGASAGEAWMGRTASTLRARVRTAEA